MTTTDPGATPGTDLALAGKAAAANAVISAARTGRVIVTVTDVKAIHAGLTAHARPIERTERTLTPLDSFSVHTGGVALGALGATALAMAQHGAPDVVRAGAGVLALFLIVLSVLGLVACSRRARKRMQGR